MEGAAWCVAADICDPATLNLVFGEVERRLGRLDALINNAAIQICKPVLDTTPREWDAVMEANLKSVFLATQRAHPLLAATRGAIVNVSSIHAIATSRNIAAYAREQGRTAGVHEGRSRWSSASRACGSMRCCRVPWTRRCCTRG